MGHRSKGHRSSIRYKRRDATNDPARATITARKRGIWPRSRITASQKSTVFLKLIAASVGMFSNEGALIKSLPHSATNAIVQHLVYALTQDFLLKEENRSVVGEHPRASARSRVWVRRCAKHGTRNALNRRPRHAREEKLQFPVEKVGICSDQK